MLNYDIIIIGSGIVGMTTALLLAKNTSYKIALLESKSALPVWPFSCYDHRVSAISLASKKIFQQAGVWNAIQAKRMSPYTKMHVWDEAGQGEIQFDCTKLGEPALGYIIEENVMRISLLDEIACYPQIDFIYPVKLISLHSTLDHIELITAEHAVLTTKLLIGADGAHSWVRLQTGIESKTHDYKQTAIVATVKTELPHQATAWQRFLFNGPLAFLPLEDPHTCSIVWSTQHAHAQELLMLDDELFQRHVSIALAEKLGKITAITERYHFPLHMRHAKQYIKERIALMGDAAHTIHPLAGQGVNLGLLDAACLVETILAADKKNRDFTNFPTLRRYERARKSDNVAMLMAVDVLKSIFVNSNHTVQHMRNRGLHFANQLLPLKKFFMNYALGNRRGLPSMITNAMN